MVHSRTRNLILAWAFAGLFFRLALMPVTFQSDVIDLQYMLREVTAGHLNIYAHYDDTYRLGPQFSATYPPMYYYLAGAFRVMNDRLSPQLAPWLEHCWGTYRAGFIHDGSGPAAGGSFFQDPGHYRLYRNLFLVKAPYLLFDAAVAASLLLLVADPRRRVWAFALWMLNPFLLVTTYAQGQHDIMTTALTVMALLLLVRKKPGPALALLSTGVMVKLFPAVFIPPVLLYYGRSRKEFLRLAAWAATPFVLVLAPLFLATHGQVLRHFFHVEATERAEAPGLLHLAQKALFAGGYLGLLAWSFLNRRGAGLERARFEQDGPERMFTGLMLLLCLGTGLEIRYYVWISPFLILMMSRDRAFFWLGTLHAFFCALLRWPQYPQIQMRLFKPLDEHLFGALPTLDTLMSQVLNTAPLYPLFYRLFLAVSLLLLVRLWWPRQVEKLLAGNLLAAAARWATAALCLFLLGTVLLGVSRWRAERRTATAPLVTWSTVSPLALDPAGSATGVQTARFTPQEEGLYGLKGIGPAGAVSGPGLPFRFTGGAQVLTVRDSLEQEGQLYGREIEFETIRDRQTLSLELAEVAGEGTVLPGGEKLEVVGLYRWVKNLRETLALFGRRLGTDPAFSHPWALSLVLSLGASFWFFGRVFLEARSRKK
ncbi:DUF2029 domain-containing protein [bacterium]|nr:DUF2029 domain-containing protein [bacterium]